jgi:YD repeat-containing protein
MKSVAANIAVQNKLNFMKKIFFMAAVAIMFILISCKKDKSQQPGPGNGGKTKLLKKTTQTENGHTTVYNWSYDANKQLTAIKSADDAESTLFTYDGDGNLIKIEETDSEFKNIYSFTYNNAAPVSGTFKSWQKHGGEADELIEDDLLTYTVSNNQVSKIHLSMTLASEEADFNLNYSNGNLAKVESEGATGYTASFTFGNKKPIFPIISKYVLDQAGFSLQFAASHELLSAAYDFPGTRFDYTITTQYTYDGDGYVLNSTDGNSQLKFEYE